MPRYTKQLPDSVVLVARRRVHAGEAIREVARDLGCAHTTLTRRFAALEKQEAATATLRRESRTAVRESGDLAAGRRPEDEDGQPVVLLVDVETANAARAVQAQRVRERADARDAEDLTNDEYWTTAVEAREVATGRKTEKEVRAARRANRRVLTRENTRARPGTPFGPPEPQGLCLSPRELLAAAFTGRV